MASGLRVWNGLNPSLNLCLTEKCILPNDNVSLSDLVSSCHVRRRSVPLRICSTIPSMTHRGSKTPYVTRLTGRVRTVSLAESSNRDIRTLVGKETQVGEDVLSTLCLTREK